MALKKGQEIEVVIEKSAFTGQGVCRVDGMALFVDRTIPGDRVKAQVYRKKNKFALARVVELLSPSPERITPPCPDAGLCGGCKLQFVDYAAQLKYKRMHVAECLEHIGGFSSTDIPVHAPLASENRFGYRNKMEFSVADRRWLRTEDMDNPDIDRSFALGLHAPGAFNRVLNTERCLLQTDTANAILNRTRALMLDSGLPPYGLISYEGFWRFLVIRRSVANDEYLVNLVTSRNEPEAMQKIKDALLAEFPQVKVIVNNVTDRKSAVAVGDVEIPLTPETRITESIGPYRFQVSANSFFQTNTLGAQLLYGKVLEYAQLTGGERVLDLYSGTGTIPIYLAGQAKEIIGLEIVESAVKDAQENCRANNVANCRFIVGDLLETIDNVPKSPDMMVIDPPRAGMHPKVVDKVLALGPERIVYVSCNPSTLARDLALMKEAYLPMEVQPVDLFPHTPHIECVVRLKKI